MQDELIPVSNGQEYLEVHPSALKQHRELGWVECDRQAQAKAPAKRKSAAADE